MAIRYPKEVHKFIQANYYGRRPEELAVLVNKKVFFGLHAGTNEILCEK